MVYNFLRRIHKKWGALSYPFSLAEIWTCLSSHAGAWGSPTQAEGEGKASQEESGLRDSETPLCILEIYLWTSVMRKRNIVLSSLSHYCLGYFYSQPKLTLTIHNENSFLTKVVPEWDSWRPRAMQPELSHSTPFRAWFSSTFPLISFVWSFPYNSTKFPFLLKLDRIGFFCLQRTLPHKTNFARFGKIWRVFGLSVYYMIKEKKNAQDTIPDSNQPKSSFFSPYIAYHA